MNKINPLKEELSHYIEQRDKLVYFLRNTLYFSNKQIGDILGISRSAVAFQWPLSQQSKAKELIDKMTKSMV